MRNAPQRKRTSNRRSGHSTPRTRFRRSSQNPIRRSRSTISWPRLRTATRSKRRRNKTSGGDRREQAVENQPSFRSRPNAVAFPIEEPFLRITIDCLGIDDRNVEARRERFDVDAFRKAQAHYQSLVRRLARTERLLLGNSVTVAIQCRKEILGLSMTNAPKSR